MIYTDNLEMKENKNWIDKNVKRYWNIRKKKMVMTPKSNNTIQQLNITKSVMQKVYWEVNHNEDDKT